PRYSLPDHLCRFRVRAALALARGFSRQHGIIHFATIGSASALRHMPGGFAYLTSYSLTPGQPPPGMDYPPASPHRLPTTPQDPNHHTHPERQIWQEVSTGRFSIGAPAPVREYQPVIHRLRLSASP